jgi:arylsulfatase A-like enzyme
MTGKNLIFICLDSFRQDHVSFYGAGKPVFDGVPAPSSPVLDAFAKDCVVFDNCHPCGLPTIPVRTELMTGQFTLPVRGWQPLEDTDFTVARLLRREGYVTGLVADTWHLWRPKMNFHSDFMSWRWIRGQEYDAWNSNPPRRNIEGYVNANYDARWRGLTGQFLANTDGFASPEDWFAPRVAEEACGWLKRNRPHGKLFLWVDSFDPHEPWDPPKAFDRFTDPAYRGKRLILPMGGEADSWATKEEQRFIRGLYAGEAAFVDDSLGRLFRAMEEGGYYDDSLIVVIADHGHPLADHGKFLKGTDRLHSELVNVPFMVRMPGRGKGRRTKALVSYPDILPTILELMGFSADLPGMAGRSFASVVRGETDTHREAVVTGYFAGAERRVRDSRFAYIRRPAGRPDELYDLAADPRERDNLIDRHPDEARRLAAAFGSSFMGRPVSVVKGIQGKYEVENA